VQFPERYFFRGENGTPQTDTFFFRLNRKARFVAITAKSPSGFLFSDELAVLKATEPARDLDGLKPVQLVTKGAAIKPKGDELVITTNVFTPQTFLITDTRKTQRRPLYRFIFDLPAGVEITPPPHVVAEKGALLENGQQRWLLRETEQPKSPAKTYGPFYFSVRSKLPANATASFAVEHEHAEHNRVTVPVRTIAIPRVELPSGFHVSLGWFNESDQENYPEFLDTFKQLGFNTISTFPRQQTSPEQLEKQAQRLRTAREKGYKVLYNESPFHEMAKIARNNPEIYHQINGERGKPSASVTRARLTGTS